MDEQEQEIVKQLKAHIRRQDELMKKNGEPGFKMLDPITGKKMLTAREIIGKINTNKKFRKILVRIVVKRTVESLPG